MKRATERERRDDDAMLARLRDAIIDVDRAHDDAYDVAPDGALSAAIDRLVAAADDVFMWHVGDSALDVAAPESGR